MSACPDFLLAATLSSSNKIRLSATYSHTLDRDDAPEPEPVRGRHAHTALAIARAVECRSRRSIAIDFPLPRSDVASPFREKSPKARRPFAQKFQRRVTGHRVDVDRHVAASGAAQVDGEIMTASLARAVVGARGRAVTPARRARVRGRASRRGEAAIGVGNRAREEDCLERCRGDGRRFVARVAAVTRVGGVTARNTTRDVRTRAGDESGRSGSDEGDRLETSGGSADGGRRSEAATNANVSTNGDNGRGREPTPQRGTAWWVVNVLQPLELLKLLGKGFLFYAAFSVTTFALTARTSAQTQPVSARYDVFVEAANRNNIRAVHVDGNQLTWVSRSKKIVPPPPGSEGTPFNEPREVEVVYHTSRPKDAPMPYDAIMKNSVDMTAPDPRQAPNYAPWLALLMFVLLVNVFRNQGQGSFGGPGVRGSPGGISMPGVQRGGRARDAIAPPTTTFADVAGVDEAKEELQEIVDILKRPEKYARLGALPPSGVMLVGAPGTGKTLLARAVAGEAGVPFISISASEFVELYVGMGAARVREVFARAKAQSPSIVFIDEIDAVAKSRGDGKMRGMGNDEREQTLNQLLTELDGFETESMVICIAATNRADTLDAALRRPGRFDRTVSVDRPDKQGRREILAVHTGRRHLPLAEDAGLDVIAQMTAGFTGADLENLVNEAALLAGRSGKSTVGYADFEAAVLRTIAGIEKKRNMLSISEKTTVSVHEVGHALVSTAVGRLIPDTERPETLSIVSRSGGALGFTYTPPTEDRWLMYKDELLGKVTTFMGGRAAEMVVCKRISSGASDDIQRATNLAYKSIAELGFSANVGPMSLSTLSSGASEDVLFGSDRASETDSIVEKEVKHILTTSLLVACDVMRANADVMADLSKALAEEEKIYGPNLQQYLDRVVAPPSLELFLKGEAPPVTAADIELMSNFPLPAVTAQTTSR